MAELATVARPYAEATFKALGRALRVACERSGESVERVRSQVHARELRACVDPLRDVAWHQPVVPLEPGQSAADVADATRAIAARAERINPKLAKPAFVYLHGNDFLKPWLGYGSWWLEGIRKPYMAELRHRAGC